MMAWLVRFVGLAVLKKYALKLVIGWVIPDMFDATMRGLENLAQRTDTRVDDMAVADIVAERAQFLAEIEKEIEARFG